MSASVAASGMTSYQGGNEAARAPTTPTMSDWLVAGRIDFGGGFRVAAAHKRVTDDNNDESG